MINDRQIDIYLIGAVSVSNLAKVLKSRGEYSRWQVLTPLERSCMCAKSFPSCPTLCDPMDFSPPGSSVHGVLQARILELVTWSSVSSRTRDQT